MRSLLDWLRPRWLRVGIALAAAATIALVPYVGQECLPPFGIARYELAGTGSAADTLVSRWGRECAGGQRVEGARLDAVQQAAGRDMVRAQLRTSVWRDFLLIPAYTILLVLCCLASARVFGRGWGAALARRVAGAQVVAGALDVVENVALLRHLDGGGSEGALQLAQLTAGFKFALLAAGGAVAGAGAVAWLRRRRRTRRRQQPAGREQDRLPGSDDSPATLDHVRAAELAYLARHRRAGRTDNEMRQGLVGLALSGGGIRAATTSLGVLQTLSRLEILPMVDYLSTVSGGGYIGTCLSSYLSLSRVPPRPGAEPVERSPSAALVGPPAAPGLLTRVMAAATRRLPRMFRRQDGARTDRGRFDQLRYAPQTRSVFSTRWQNFPFRAFEPDRASTNGAGATQVDADTKLGTDIIAHLRTHGDFLVARKGLLRRHSMRAIGTLLTGVMYSLGLFALTLFAAVALYLATALSLVPRAPEDLALRGWPADIVAADTATPLVAIDSSVLRTRTEPCLPGQQDCVVTTRTRLGLETAPRRIVGNFGRVWRAAKPVALRPLAAGAVAGSLAIALAYLVLRRRRGRYVRGDQLPPSPSLQPGESAENLLERGALWLVATLLGGTIIATVVVLRWSAWGRAVVGADAIESSGAGQALWLFVPLAVLLGARVTSGAFAVFLLPRFGHHTRRGRSLSGGVQAITIYGWWAALAFAVLPLVIYGLMDATFGELGVGALGSLLLTRLLAARGASAGKGRLSLSPGFRRALLGVVVALLLLLGVLFAGVVLAGIFRGSPYDWWITLGLVGAFVLLGFAVNHNVVSPHYFYRDRLAETYLHAELPDTRHRLHPFHDVMEMPLHYLHGIPLRYDDDAHPELRDARNDAPYHLISAAINLAGSHDLTRKDRKSGYWLFSKLYCGSTHTGFRPTHLYREGETKLARAMTISGAAASSGIGFGTFFAQAFAAVLFNVRLGYWLENPRRPGSKEWREGGTFWPYFLWKEMVMDTTEHDWLVNLSDGGHTGDNVGIYPLLQRHCKVIVAVDAERDPALTFGSFTEALRHAYVDLGVSVDIDLAMLRPDAETGLSRSHCAIGRIHYPDRPHQRSYLVYMKNSLTGDEQEPVLNYKATCPDFPHESTVDQFFDDAQFESYRALGVHIAEHAFAPWAGTHLFDVARAYHGPTPHTNS